MASNSFGKLYSFTSWGESHGKAIGVVVDGVPAGITLDINLIQAALNKRKPGVSKYTSPRREQDKLEVLSGIFNGASTGAPISCMVINHDVDSTSYKHDGYRPGHADYTYHKKYNNYDPLGGGRASARETIARVIAGAIAEQILAIIGVKVYCYISSIGNLDTPLNLESINWQTISSDQYAGIHPDIVEVEKIYSFLEQIMLQGNTVGGAVSFVVNGVPVGWGEPVYDKLSARLAYALMSIPAAKGFGIGSGFNAKTALGSEYNDQMQIIDDAISFKTNFSGGVLGGISSGQIIHGEVIFKPISSIKHQQDTISFAGKNTTYTKPKHGRHDPSAVIRAIPVVRAMVQCVLLDMALIANSYNTFKLQGENEFIK